MAIDASDALTQLVALAGVVIGSVIGATVIPYIKAQAKYGQFDIAILFKKEFLLTCAGSVVTTFVFVSGIFNSILTQTLANNPVTYIAVFGSALGIGFTLNTVANAALPSPTNKEAAKELEERKMARALTLRGIDLEKLSNMQDNEVKGTIYRSTSEGWKAINDDKKEDPNQDEPHIDTGQVL